MRSLGSSFNLLIGIFIISILLSLGFSDTGLNDLIGKSEEKEEQIIPKPEEAEEKDDKGSILDWGREELKQDEYHLGYVVDGDTIVVLTNDGVEERVRLLLMDTPESVHPNGKVELFGPESSAYAKEYFKGVKKVTLEIGENPRDKYDRLLAHVFVDGENFGLHMVEEGYARVAYVYEPNTKYIEDFRRAETRAKDRGENIWSIKGYVSDKGFDMSVVD